MTILSDHRDPELDDYQRFRQDFRRLEQITMWSWWLTVAVTAAVVAAVVAVLFVKLFANILPAQQGPVMLLFALLTAILLSNTFTLVQQRQFKLFRHRIVQQMDLAGLRAEKFHTMAIIDPLTGMYNRRFGAERLKEEINRAERKGQDLAVIALDMDKFKEINDQLGHAAGDLVLKELSRRLLRAIRAGDIPVRLGGDEFLLILPECSRKNIDIILSRLGPFDVKLGSQTILVSFSLGHAHYEVSDTPEKLVERADQRLYAHKQARKKSAGPEAEAPDELAVVAYTPEMLIEHSDEPLAAAETTVALVERTDELLVLADTPQMPGEGADRRLYADEPVPTNPAAQDAPSAGEPVAVFDTPEALLKRPDGRLYADEQVLKDPIRQEIPSPDEPAVVIDTPEALLDRPDRRLHVVERGRKKSNRRPVIA